MKPGTLKPLRGNTALDSSVLIEYLTGTNLGSVLRDYFQNMGPREIAYVSHLTLAETYYVLCRLEGSESANQKLSQMLSSNMIQPIASLNLAIETGRLKCVRAISLPDCSCLATAKETKSQPVFATQETDLKREINRKPFDPAPTFLEDMLS